MEAIYRNIGTAIHFVIQQERRPDGSRGIRELVRVTGHNGISFQTETLYRRMAKHKLVQPLSRALPDIRRAATESNSGMGGTGAKSAPQ